MRDVLVVAGVTAFFAAECPIEQLASALRASSYSSEITRMPARFPTALALVALVAASTSQASARRPVSDASAVITTRARLSYALTVTNRGLAPIKCFRFHPAYPVQILGAQGGVQFVGNIISWGSASLDALETGERVRIWFQTDRPYPVRAEGELTLNHPSYRDVCVFPGRRVRVTGPRRPR